jgi:acyl-CoA thioesterase YciA
MNMILSTRETRKQMDNVLYVYAIPIVILPAVAAVRKLSDVTGCHTASRSRDGVGGGIPENTAARTRHRHAGRREPDDIFGGWLLSQMDLAGGSLAAQRARGRCATVAVDGMVFHEPVFVGDEVSCYGELIQTGRTSMTVRIEAWRRHLPSDEVRKVTQAVFTYVAIGEDRRPRPLPPAI